MRIANLALRFALELAVLAAVGYWGFTASPHLPLRLLVGLGGPLVMAAAWGTFASPKASVPLRGAARAAFEVVWFGLGAAALAGAGHVVLAVVLFALHVANTLLLRSQLP